MEERPGKAGHANVRAAADPLLSPFAAQVDECRVHECRVYECVGSMTVACDHH